MRQSALAISVLCILGLTLTVHAASSAKDISEDDLEKEFDIRIIGKKFRSEEAAALAKNEKEIDKVNNDPNSTFKEKVGEFTNMEKNEFEEHLGWEDDEAATADLEARGLYTGMDFSQMEKQNPENDRKLKKLMNRIAMRQEELPDFYDARDHGLVTEPKGQGACGSCYAFAGAAMHETALLKAGADMAGMDLSEQFIIDCGVPLKMNDGCGGGLPHKTSALMIKLGGFSPNENDWGYVKRRQCPEKDNCVETDPYKNACEDIMSKSETWHDPGVKMTDYTFCMKNCNPELLKHVIWTYGSAAVSVMANGNWGNYASGVLNGYTCRKGSPHAVQAIGWGQDEDTGIPYWIVKNSWGKRWGDNGFAKIQQGQCGIDTRYFAWSEAVLTDNAEANPDHFCDLSNFDGGVADGIHNLRFKETVDCRQRYSKRKCKKMGKLGQLIDYVRETRVFCKDNICRCGLAKKQNCCFAICGNEEGCNFTE